MSAARRYRDVVAGLSAAADALRAADRERALALATLLVELDRAMVDAQSRAALTRAVVDVQWEMALDALWAESWLTLRPQPDPPPFRSTAGLDAIDAELERTATALHDAVRRRRFGLPGR